MTSSGSLRAAVLLLTLAVSADAMGQAAISGRVLDAQGKGIEDAVVFVQSPGEAPSAPRTATMDQIDKTFVPHVLPIVVDTRVRFPNRDQIRHHVYSFSRPKTFELPLYRGEEAKQVLFDKVGVVKIGCNIHDWMSGVILVLPSTHFATTDKDGRFRLPDLRAGTYTLAAWHEFSRGKTDDTLRQVQVAAADVDVEFHLALTDPLSRPAVHGPQWDQ